MRALIACALLACAAPALQAAPASYADTGGTVTQGATTLSISGATVANPAGTVSIDCTLTPISTQYGFSSEWSCTDGSLTLKSADGSTSVIGVITSAVFTLAQSEVNRVYYYRYALYANFSASQTLNGKTIAVAGAITQTLATLTTPLTSVSGTIQAGLIQADSQYEPVYVADTGNNRIVRTSDMLGSNWTSFGAGGSGTGQFSSPWGVATDSSGRIYVSDSGNCRIVRMDTMGGANWTAFGSCGNGTGQFNDPLGLWVDTAGRIYVADAGNDRIVRMDDMSGTQFTALGTHGAGVGQFSGPAAVTTDSAGNIYVADTLNARVVEFADMLGTRWAAWQFPLNYLTPDGVAVDASGRIYTTDSLQSQIIRGDNISGANEVSLDVNYLLYLNGVQSPSGIFVDADGGIYIADTRNNRVDRLFGMTYTNQVVLGTAGAGVGNLSLPHAVVAVRPAGRIAAASVTPPSLVFPTELEGVASPQQSTRLSNIGNVALGITSVSSSAADFPVTSDCPSILVAGQSCTATLDFQPVAGGLRKGKVSFALQHATSKTVPVSGSGALVTVSPSELIMYFGAGGTVTVTNPLATATSVKKVRVYGNFKQTNDCGALAPGASCTIQVSWIYTGLPVVGSLEVVDGAGTAQYVSMTGE